MEREPWEERLAAIEARLARLEASMAERAPVPPPATVVAPPAAPVARYGALPSSGWRTTTPVTPAASPSTPATSAATLLLGWGGALALVLAAAYLIRLAIESGWLTPVSQVVMAVAVALGMIVAGFRLKAVDARYAGLLPAGGVVILFLAIYGAHHVFALLDHGPAALAVVMVCLGSLWLGRAFASDLYAFFAVVGSYAVPVLMSSPPSVFEMTGYFLAWALVFAGFSVWQARRQVYLLAAVMGIVVLAWCFDTRDDAWQAHALLQSLHVLLLWAALVLVSYRTAQPLTLAESLRHVTPLLLFYGIQFTLWDSHARDIMVWALLLPAALWAVVHRLERAAAGTPADGTQALLWWWLAVWSVHALWHETLPDRWGPWLACAGLPAVAILLRLTGTRVVVLAPLLAAAGLMAFLTLIRLLLEDIPAATPARGVLLPVLALEAWALWAWVRRTPGRVFTEWTALLTGHVAALAAVIDLVSIPIAQSALWAMLGLAWIAVSRLSGALRPAQSALPVFALAAGKVLLFDLSGAAPLARIASLAVIGVSFYAGGLFYQRSAASSRAVSGG
jgi:hypothetical protein